MELTLVGLQNAGKTTLVNVVAVSLLFCRTLRCHNFVFKPPDPLNLARCVQTGGYSEDMIPTVGFNMRKVTKGKVNIKLWDLGGQPRFRSMWERYCRGVNAIMYVNALRTPRIISTGHFLRPYFQLRFTDAVNLIFLGESIQAIYGIFQVRERFF